MDNNLNPGYVLPYVRGILENAGDVQFNYSLGTVDVSNGSTVVVGSGTLWNSALVCGIFALYGGEGYVVDEVHYDTSISLDRPYTDCDCSCASYNIIVCSSSYLQDDYPVLTAIGYSDPAGLAAEWLARDESIILTRQYTYIGIGVSDPYARWVVVFTN